VLVNIYAPNDRKERKSGITRKKKKEEGERRKKENGRRKKKKKREKKEEEEKNKRRRRKAKKKKSKEEKKRHYNQRIVEIKHSSFTPLVFSAYGGETQHFFSTLANKIATNKHLEPSIIITWLREKIALFHARVFCVRGSRSWHKPLALVAEIYWHGFS
jgi:flagellum-specific peptidoglycan hydrolase FlgJ